MTHPYFVDAPYPRVLAHRGLASPDSAEAPIFENTAGAFASAHAAGAEYIETDCRTTADGDVVLFHDNTLTRLLKDDRRTDEVRTAELADLMAPYGGLLTVAEMLEMFPESRFNIDVKTDAAAAGLGQVIAPHAHRVLLTSFADDRRRRVIRDVLDAGAKVRPAASGGRTSIATIRLLAALHISPARVYRELDALQIPEHAGALRVLTPALLRGAHRHGVEVHVWTVNETADMRRLVEMGVDGIVTDRADAAIATLF